MGRMRIAGLLAIAVALTVSACGGRSGPPDRQDTFSVAGGECTAKWWLGPLVDSVPEDAARVARESLASAEVTADDLNDWKTTILDSQSSDRKIPEAKLEGYAYVEGVRSDVRAGLAESGYPDSPRLIEARADVDCS